MTFTESISTCLKKYADFNGRARRSEYWWFVLFQLLVDLGSRLATVVMALSEFAGDMLSLLCFLPILLPGIAVTARRLHDVTRSGWWMLIPLTIIGIIPYLYWMCKEGDAQANQYGPPV